MGQTLSEPITDKHSESGRNDRLIYGASSMQGWRSTMEDAHTAVLDLYGSSSSHADRAAFFGVFDGHGGDRIAKYVGTRLHHKLVESEHFKTGDYKKALEETFLGIDEELLRSKADPELQDDPAGCTAVVALITSDKTIVANAGDSRCVLSRNGRAIPLSRDHKPKDADEYSRILAAGGYVNFGRVNGNLALSRAIGDFEFKRNSELGPEKQVITAKPDVLEHTLTDDDEFLIVACDGIWDCMPNQQVINFIRERLSEDKQLDIICEELMDRCLASAPWVMEGIGADNMTLIIVGLLGNKSTEEWIAQCSKAVPIEHMGGGSADDQMVHILPDSTETSKGSLKHSLPDSGNFGGG